MKITIKDECRNSTIKAPFYFVIILFFNNIVNLQFLKADFA